MNKENTEDTQLVLEGLEPLGPPWEGGEHVPTDKEYATAMEELLNENTLDELGHTISGVLEFLTMRAFQQGPYYIMTDDGKAITVFAADTDAALLKSLLPERFKAWDEEEKAEGVEVKVITNRDTGDEQPDDAE